MSRIIRFRVIERKEEKIGRNNYKLISHCIIIINSVIFNYKITEL